MIVIQVTPNMLFSSSYRIHAHVETELAVYQISRSGAVFDTDKVLNFENSDWAYTLTTYKNLFSPLLPSPLFLMNMAEVPLTSVGKWNFSCQKHSCYLLLYISHKQDFWETQVWGIRHLVCSKAGSFFSFSSSLWQSITSKYLLIQSDNTATEASSRGIASIFSLLKKAMVF